MKTIKTILSLIIVLPGLLVLSLFEAQAQDTDLYKDQNADQYENKFSYNVLSELHYNNVVYDKNGSTEVGKFDLHELHFKAGYKVNKYLKFKTALEIEHAFDSYYNGGDVFFKQAYFDYHKSDRVGLKVGLVNLPVTGSKSKIYSGVEIAPVEKYLSYAWRELGVVAYGDLTSKLSYQTSLTTGLEATEISSKSGIYSARNNSLLSSINNLAAAAQVKYKLNYNFTLGTSALFSGLQSNQEFGGSLEGAAYTLMEGFAAYKSGAITSRLVGVYSTIQESDKINQILGKHIGSSQYGSLIEVTYNFLYDPNTGSKTKHFIVYSRVEAYNTQLTTIGFEADPKYERFEYTLGVLYKPFKQIEFKTDYQWLNSSGKKNLGQLNLAVAYSF
ncbi:hypothetical protein ACKGJO_06180 [Gracilimonas sp. Q87]|uniref:hypothetical protein n=1 Tax=Gracilimonas sp. Q87 TaxID=3384766 RepID=UPI0039843144